MPFNFSGNLHESPDIQLMASASRPAREIVTCVLNQHDLREHG
jgi:hypothetical protein